MAQGPPTDWNSGLWDCFEDASTCCYGFWCRPCLSSTVSGRFGESACLPLCDICIPSCVPPVALSIRAAIRHRYNIKGSLCEDIVISCFCGWCSWCQMHRELKERKKTPIVVTAASPTFVTMQPAPVVMMPANPQPTYYVNQPQVVMASN